MGKLVVTEFVTLDGVAQAPGGPDEDRDSGFQHGGWQAPLLDESSGADLFDQAKDMDALLLGRRTFDIFADYWPNAPEEIPFTELLNRVPKYVASTTLSAPLAWDASLLEGDLVEAIQAVKDRHEHVEVIGSLGLVQTLLTHRLVDRLHLWLYPLALGSGKQVFAEGTVPTAFTLVDSTPYPGGAVHLTYDPVGEPTYGDMTVHESGAIDG
jgi:dihydrofolate reductase